MNRVYWITGLSGAGKTTIGKIWHKELKEKKLPAVFLDGDELRRVFGDDLGYGEADRRKCAMRYARLCALLGGQGLEVVCCTISMFEEVHRWNRKHIPGYCEVYVKASLGTLRQRNQKGLYSHGGDDVAGISLKIEEPKNPDIVLYNDGDVPLWHQIQLLHQWRKEREAKDNEFYHEG